MNLNQLHGARTRLANLFQKYEQLPEDDLVRAHWSRYLCVLSSGYIEVAVRAILHDYAIRKAHPNVAAYVEAQMKRQMNINMERLLQVVVAFNDNWANEILAMPDYERFKAAIDSININRNLIAHGDNTGISYARMSEYHQGALELLEVLTQKCADPPNQ